MQTMNALSLFAILPFCSLNLNAQDYQGKYCELDGATTDSGQEVTGECYMYSDQYGEPLTNALSLFRPPGPPPDALVRAPLMQSVMCKESRTWKR